MQNNNVLIHQKENVTQHPLTWEGFASDLESISNIYWCVETLEFSCQLEAVI